jgi:hypothetical protein
MKELSSIRIVMPLLAVCLLIPFAVSAATISFSPSSVTVDPSGTATIDLTIDELPQGLAGYDAVVTIADPVVAEITAVSFPSWAGLSNATGVPSASVRLSAVDINRQVQPGATGVVLGTITVTGKSPGSATINVENLNVDADGGSRVETTAGSGAITVRATLGEGTSERAGSSSPIPLPGIIAVAAVIGTAAVVVHRTVLRRE